jgi:hypothetical protein
MLSMLSTTRKPLYLQACRLALPAKPYTCWLAGFACHFATKNFLHGGGRAEPNGPMAAERLRKLFIFFIKSPKL